jgi:hypothetical protein
VQSMSCCKFLLLRQMREQTSAGGQVKGNTEWLLSPCAAAIAVNAALQQVGHLVH